MIATLLFLLQAAAAGPPDPVAARFDRCAALVKSDAAKGVAEAEQWQRAGGGLPARLCLGLGYVEQERWAPAEIVFTQAATEAEIQRDGRAASLWVQAANAALAGDDPARARASLDRALALPVLTGALRGEAHLDRARAAVALGDLASARKDLDEAVVMVPTDPLAWLLSATLARRQGDAARATKDIACARRLDPTAPAIVEEEARIAALPKPAAAPSGWRSATAALDSRHALSPHHDPGQRSRRHRPLLRAARPEGGPPHGE
jgi:tetratricopeptide (TPR) repeat protein